MQRQNLICLNSHSKCEGAITRHRKTILGDEKAILDFVIVCDQLAAFLQRMIIDEKRSNVLTKYVTLKGVRVKSESDHNPVFAEFNLKFSRAQPVTRHEMFEFKNVDSQKKFYELTNNCFKLRNCFDGQSDPKVATDRFFKTLNNVFHAVFKKIRIRPSKPFSTARGSRVGELLSQKTDLGKVIKNSKCEFDCDAAKKDLEQVEMEIFQILSAKNAKIVTDQVADLDSLDGSFNQIGMWKIKNKICPRPKDPPLQKRITLGI